MARPPEDVVGLDIGAGELKVAIVRDDQAVRIGHARLPEGIIVDGLLVDPNALTREVKRLWRKLSLKTKRVNFAVANRQVQFRLHAMPRSSNPDDLHLVIVTGAEMWFAPMRLDQTVVDYAEQQAAEVGRIDLEICAADKGMVNSYVKALKKAGLRPSACQYGPLIETRALAFPRDQVHSHVLINIGAEKTSFVATNGLDVLFSRLIDIGGNDFTRAIAERLHIPFEAAEKLKRTYGLNQPSEADEDLDLISLAQQALLPPTDRLVQALADMRAYYERQPEIGRPVQGVSVIGGGARLSGLTEQIALYLSLPLTPPVPLDNFEVVPEIDLYAGALGLAWKRPMSLLPSPAAGSAQSKGSTRSKVDRRKADKLSRELRRKQAAANPLLIGAAIGLVLMIGQFFYADKLKKDQAALTGTAIAQPVSFVGGVPQVNQAASLLSSEPPPQILAGIGQAFRDVSITGATLSAAAGSYAFQGTISNASDVDRIKADLAQATAVNVLSGVLPGNNGESQFNINIKWKAP